MRKIDAIVPDWPAPTSVRALTTTRAGGVSRGPWAALNLAAHVDDDPAAVAANRARLIEAFGLPAEPLWLDQVHGTAVHVSGYRRGTCADACFADRPGAVCAVLTADCLPVLICDRSGTAVAAAHAGWRGLLAGVIEQTLAHFDAAAADLLVWLGPAIGPQAFEVGDEVRSAFLADDDAADVHFLPHRPGHWLADLYGLARLRLQRRGVAAIHGGGLCTYNDSDRFYSYRRDGVTGRMASLIWLQTRFDGNSDD